MRRVSTIFSQIFKIDIRPLTSYCKGILSLKKNVLTFAIAALKECFVEFTSGCSKLKVLMASLLVRSQEINSSARQCYMFCPLGKHAKVSVRERLESFQFPHKFVFTYLSVLLGRVRHKPRGALPLSDISIPTYFLF